jgi:hypothetical protein
MTNPLPTAANVLQELVDGIHFPEEAKQRSFPRLTISITADWFARAQAALAPTAADAALSVDREKHLSKLSPEDMLEELLAVIHGDGGHYSDAHGLAKAVADAEKKWYGVQAPITQAADSARLDWLETQRQVSIDKGFQWNAWNYDARQSKLTIREQIDKERAALSASTPTASPTVKDSLIDGVQGKDGGQHG